MNNGNSPMAQLHIENQRMEERLRTLKKVMAVEKNNRSETNGYWKSSQSVSLLSNKTNETITCNPNKQLQKSHQKKRKIKVLTGKEQEPEENKLSCGQCDQFKASISCIECVENYCTVCFTRFHQKGALSHHRVRPLANAKVNECSKPMQSKQSNTCSIGVQHDVTCSTGVQHDVTCSTGVQHDDSAANTVQPQAGSLLDGKYNEEDSSKYFQEALLAWRSSRAVSNQQEDHHIPSTSSCGIQTSSSPDNKSTVPSQIHFKDTPTISRLSYMEKLMLKRKKSDPFYLKIDQRNSHTVHNEANSTVNAESLLAVHNEANSTVNAESLLVRGPSEHNVFYSENEHTIEYNQMIAPDWSGCVHSSVSTVTIEDVTECLRNSDDNNKNEQDNVTLTSNTHHILKTNHQKNVADAVRLPNNNGTTKTRKNSARKKRKPSKLQVKNKSSQNLSNNTPDIGTVIQAPPAPVYTPDIGTVIQAPPAPVYKGLADFFLMDTMNNTVESNETDAEYDTAINVSTNAPLLVPSGMWLPATSSIVTHQTSLMNPDDFSRSDLPPHCVSFHPSIKDDADSASSNDYSEETLESAVSQESIALLEVLQDEQDEEERVLDELANEIMSLSRNEQVNETENMPADIRPLSRMTLEELVHDFEEYQQQVINEED